MTTAPDYTVELLEGGEHFARLKEEWIELWRQSPEASEAQTWHWQSLYWKHVAPRRTPLFLAARDSQGGLAALGTFFIRRHRQTLLNHLEFLGEHDADYHLLLRRPDAPVELGGRMFETLLRAQAKAAAVVELNNMPMDSWTAATWKARLGEAGRGQGLVRTWFSDTFQIPLPGAMADYWRQLHKDSRARLQNKMRRLHKDFRVEFRVPAGETEVAAGLADAEKVDRARWGDATKFSAGAEGDFLRAMISELCRAGIGHLFLLYLNGACAAYNVGFLVRERIIFPYVAADFAMGSKYSLGLMNNVLAIESCISRGVKTYDLSRGSESYKARLGGTLSQNLNVSISRSQAARLLGAWNKRTLGPLLQRRWVKSVARACLNKE